MVKSTINTRTYNTSTVYGLLYLVLVNKNPVLLSSTEYYLLLLCWYSSKHSSSSITIVAPATCLRITYAYSSTRYMQCQHTHRSGSHKVAARWLSYRGFTYTEHTNKQAYMTKHA